MSACDDDHCITCADEGVAMRVLGHQANGVSTCVAADGGRAEVMTELVAPVEDGDLVLVHAGVAIARLEEQ
jgi:hydrogenase maturation factor